jgi:hypothetical protein
MAFLTMIAFVLQIGASRRVARAHSCPDLLSLVYPSRTRGVLSVLKMSNATS